MNERIRLLAEQAGIELPDDSIYNGHIYRNSLERFAQLIVRECAKIADEPTSHPFDSYGLKIREHFGVE